MLNWELRRGHGWTHNNNKGNAVSTNKRVFLSLVIPEHYKQKIDQWRERHLYTLDRTPIPKDNLHITLVYMGMAEPIQLKKLADQLQRVAADSFSMNVNRTEYWPEPKNLHLAPTIIPPKLVNLQRQVNQIVEQVGLMWEKRPYRPHMTLYKKVTSEQFEDLLLDGLPEPHIDIPIEHFAIYESVSDETGLHYDLIEQYDLTGAPIYS